MLSTAPNAGIPATLRKPTVDEIAGMLGPERRTLYVNRPLKNAEDLIAWARAAGFKKTLPADDIHVTLAFSRDPVDWDDVDPSSDPVVVPGGHRTVEPLGDKGAVVLRFESSDLEDRWQQFRDVGAAWDWPGYKPHVTITYDAGDDDITKVRPYDGPLEFGPEVFAEVDNDWAAKAKSSLVGDEFNEGDHPRAANGEFGSGGGSNGSTESKSERARLVFKKHAAAATDFVKGSGELLAGVVSSHKLQHAAKEGLILGINALISHGSQMHGSFLDSHVEEFVSHTVHNFSVVAGVATEQAREVMRAAVETMLKVRGASLGKDAEEDEDGINAVLQLLLKMLGKRGATAKDSRASRRRAAGVMFEDALGRVLLMQRSQRGDFPGTWAFPAGHLEGNETPEEAARREAAEETGFEGGGEGGGGDMAAVDESQSEALEFHTFRCPVAEPFEPKLTDEHTAFAWADPKVPPTPLHPGVAETLARIKAPTTATDSALRLALDRDSVRDVDRAGRLRVAVTNISKATVNPYFGHEIPDWEKLGLDPNKIYRLLRDPEELAKAAPTFNGVQLLRKHKPVSADDHQPWDVVGTTGTDAEFVDPYLRNSLFIWAGDAIAEVESDAKKELSCGYHYRADMTPGEFGGMRFDGVMREIVGNHIALVKDGRAGADVVVGDSNEVISMSNADLAKTLNAVATRQVTIGALVTYLKPRLAMDAKISLAKAFTGITGKTFKEKKPAIAASIREQAKGKLAKDASLDDVEKVLDMLDGHEVDGGDATVSETQHNAMEAAANGNSALGIPEAVGEEFAMKDNLSGEAGLREYLKSKGMSEEDIDAAIAAMKPAAEDEAEETDEKKKKREKEEADKRAAEEKAAKDKSAKDAEMKNMVTKPAMDAAIAAATEAATKMARETERGIRAALADVRSRVGDLPESMAFDSGEDVLRHALTMLGVENAKTIHGSALKTILDLQPLPGARAAQTPIAMDSASAKGFADRFPDANRIGVV